MALEINCDSIGIQDQCRCDPDTGVIQWWDSKNKVWITPIQGTLVDKGRTVLVYKDRIEVNG